MRLRCDLTAPGPVSKPLTPGCLIPQEMVQGNLRLPVESPQLTRVCKNGHISPVWLQPAD